MPFLFIKNGKLNQKLTNVPCRNVYTDKQLVLLKNQANFPANAPGGIITPCNFHQKIPKNYNRVAEKIANY